jgi:flagellar motor switch protein FliM
LFDKPTSEPLTALVNEREKFNVFAGVNRDKLTVQVANIIESEE